MIVSPRRISHRGLGRPARAFRSPFRNGLLGRDAQATEDAGIQILCGSLDFRGRIWRSLVDSYKNATRSSRWPIVGRAPPFTDNVICMTQPLEPLEPRTHLSV